MGIQGLTKYVENQSDRYLKYYELRDTYLVIDGNSVACQLYSRHAKCICAFGGEYEKYAQCVSDFFDDLLKCNVTPLIVFDGGCEDKKLKTVIKRTKDKIRTTLNYSPSNMHISKFFPLFLKQVFIDVVREKDIRLVQCLFEADGTIAAVARLLDCPVLSYDSDFYIYGSLYIPFSTLDKFVVKSSNGGGYMKRCQIYRIENLIGSFKGLDRSLVALAAILLGNDYVHWKTFKNFFRQMKLHGAKTKMRNHRQCRIAQTFTWLSRYSLDKAVIAVLCRLPKHRRKTVLNIIETNINNYSNVSAEILKQLGFSKEFTARANAFSINRVFQFDDDINNLTYINETCDGENSETSEDEEEEEDNVEIANILQDTDLCSDDVLIDRLPSWFINDFHMGKFPTYFMDLIVRNLYICPVQIEDSFYPSSVTVSLTIVNVIYRLLMAGVNNKTSIMNYMTRGKNKVIARHEFDCVDNSFSRLLPSLRDVKELPSFVKQEILNNTLEIPADQLFDELPSEWILYIATIKYWTEKQKGEWYKLDCYIYSLLLCMLLNLVDRRIGKHRVQSTFQKKYSGAIASIHQTRKIANNKPCYSVDVTLADALSKINRDDCLLAVPFFLRHLEVDRRLCSNSKKYEKSVVHAYSEFQSCLMHSMDLNALLSYPYPQPKVADLFNGTLLYNLYRNLKTRTDVETYVATALHDSPSLSRFFKVLLLKVRPIFSTLLQSDVNVRKRQRTKHKFNESVTRPDPDEPRTIETVCDVPFYDANNTFTLLNSIHA